MMRKARSKPDEFAVIPANIPDQVLHLFRDTMFLAHETPEEYYDLVEQLVTEYDPQSVTDWLYIKDAADSSWDVRRYRFLIGVGIQDAFAPIWSRAYRRVGEPNDDASDDESGRPASSGGADAAATSSATGSDGTPDIDELKDAIWRAMAIVGQELQLRKYRINFDQLKALQGMLRSAQAQREWSIAQLETRRMARTTREVSSARRLPNTPLDEKGRKCGEPDNENVVAARQRRTATR